MGRVFSYLKNYNIENRAYREIDRQAKAKVAKAAPKHVTSDVNIEDQLYQDQAFDKVDKRNEELINRVGSMNISAVTNLDFTRNASRSLPTNPISPDEPEFGFMMPRVAKPGKITLAQVCDVLTQHIDSETPHTAEDISKKYDISIEKASNILKYYSALNLYLPKQFLEQNENVEKAIADFPTDSHVIIGRTKFKSNVDEISSNEVNNDISSNSSNSSRSYFEDKSAELSKSNKTVNG